ncbi:MULTISPECIES: hypothetical protein [Furfurilactobacillus]|uniref:Helix-turn-helix domain-containing protein n=1 Tax=Furfurilactobacillus rossiae TaxID=231049 RepID=A0A7C9IUH3_9LACO|nr:hypothetical protein [Furfurilactobacillus milii]MYV05921.1 hypothetical protein [Furfurilactobacillus milii]
MDGHATPAKQMIAERTRFLNLNMDVFQSMIHRKLNRSAIILWITMLDNTPDWNFSASELQRRAGLSRQAYSTAIKELQDFGFSC